MCCEWKNTVASCSQSIEVRSTSSQDQPHRLHGPEPASDDLIEVLALQREQPVVDVEEQVVLRGEVVVERALRDARGGHDLLHAGLCVALLREELDRHPHGALSGIGIGEASVMVRAPGPGFRPPSMTRVWPVIQAASSESRKPTGPATSAGSPRRFSG